MAIPIPMVKNLPELHLSLPQFFFRAFLFGDVLYHADGASDPAGVILKVLTFFLDKAGLSVVTTDDAVFNLIPVLFFLDGLLIGRIDQTCGPRGE